MLGLRIFLLRIWLVRLLVGGIARYSIRLFLCPRKTHHRNLCNPIHNYVELRITLPIELRAWVFSRFRETEHPKTRCHKKLLIWEINPLWILLRVAALLYSIGTMHSLCRES